QELLGQVTEHSDTSADGQGLGEALSPKSPVVLQNLVNFTVSTATILIPEAKQTPLLTEATNARPRSQELITGARGTLRLLATFSQVSEGTDPGQGTGLGTPLAGRCGGADGAAASGILQLPRALARPPRHPGQHRALSPTGVQRRDFRLLNPAGEALHDGFHPQCTHLRSGLAVLHPPREAVPGFHRHRSLLPPPGLLDLQLALPLDADVVAGAHRVHSADGGHRRVPVHENRAAGDPPQLRPQIQRIDCRWQPRAAFCHCSRHNASNASESSLKKHSRSV
uniref:SYS1 golgi trafficking protein n=1 Tax=Serinus canaria TaxID=9135 RepID=A0A8C9UFP5_SERCA